MFNRKPRTTIPVRVRGRIVAILVRQARISVIVEIAVTPRATNASRVRTIEAAVSRQEAQFLVLTG